MAMTPSSGLVSEVQALSMLLEVTTAFAAVHMRHAECSCGDPDCEGPALAVDLVHKDGQTAHAKFWLEQEAKPAPSVEGHHAGTTH